MFVALFIVVHFEFFNNGNAYEGTFSPGEQYYFSSIFLMNVKETLSSGENLLKYGMV